LAAADAYSSAAAAACRSAAAACSSAAAEASPKNNKNNIFREKALLRWVHLWSDSSVTRRSRGTWEKDPIAGSGMNLNDLFSKRHRQAGTGDRHTTETEQLRRDSDREHKVGAGTNRETREVETGADTQGRGNNTT